MIELDLNILQQLGYIFSAILFIYGLKMLSNESTAARGNIVSSIGMLFAVLVTVIEIVNPVLVLSAVLLGALIGSAFALKVKMTSIPEMVALFNGFGGLSSFFLAWSEFNNLSAISLIMILSFMTVLIGNLFGKCRCIFQAFGNLKGIIIFNKASRWFLIFSFLL